jgi:hypothetical protein
MVPPEVPVTRAEFEEMQAMVKDLHDALMVPQPGQGKSLLERMATVTIGIEGGARTVKWALFLLGALAALGISMKVGVDVGGVVK